METAVDQYITISIRVVQPRMRRVTRHEEENDFLKVALCMNEH